MKARNILLTINLVCISLIVFIVIAVISAKYEHRISRKFQIDFSISKYLWNPISNTFPEFFHLRNRFVQWSNGEHTEIPVWGFIDRHSVLPGDSFNLFLSIQPGHEPVRGVVEAYRIGYYGDSSPASRLVSTSREVLVDQQEMRDSISSVGALWSPTISDMDTGQWTTGFYSFDFVTSENERISRIAYMVIRDPEKKGDVLAKISTNTYQAYNRWGNYSLYRSYTLGKKRKHLRGYMVSFDRPLDRTGMHHFFQWEDKWVVWLEKMSMKHKFSVAYATNFDVSIDPDYSREYRTLVTVGHDEYWTREEFENTYNRIYEHGQNTLFLGANLAYWQVRYLDINQPNGGEFFGRQMLCYKSPLDPIGLRSDADSLQDLTAQYRDLGRRPENMMMGVAFQGAGRKRQLYFVASTDSYLFSGTGYEPGELVGPIVGHEWDNLDPLGDGKRLYVEGVSAIPALPKSSLKVLFQGEPRNDNGKKQKAEAVYFVAESGAKVFSAGSVDWIKGLAMEGEAGDKFRKFNENLLLDFLDRLDG